MGNSNDSVCELLFLGTYSQRGWIADTTESQDQGTLKPRGDIGKDCQWRIGKVHEQTLIMFTQQDFLEYCFLWLLAPQAGVLFYPLNPWSHLKWVLGNALFGATHALRSVSSTKVVLRFAKHLQGFGSGCWFLGNNVPSKTLWAYDLFHSGQFMYQWRHSMLCLNVSVFLCFLLTDCLMPPSHGLSETLRKQDNSS